MIASDNILVSTNSTTAHVIVAPRELSPPIYGAKAEFWVWLVVAEAACERSQTEAHLRRINTEDNARTANTTFSTTFGKLMGRYKRKRGC